MTRKALDSLRVNMAASFKRHYCFRYNSEIASNITLIGDDSINHLENSQEFLYLS